MACGGAHWQVASPLLRSAVHPPGLPVGAGLRQLAEHVDVPGALPARGIRGDQAEPACQSSVTPRGAPGRRPPGTGPSGAPPVMPSADELSATTGWSTGIDQSVTQPWSGLPRSDGREPSAGGDRGKRIGRAGRGLRAGSSAWLLGAGGSWPILLSMRSRSGSAWPLCRAYSSITCRRPGLLITVSPVCQIAVQLRIKPHSTSVSRETGRRFAVAGHVLPHQSSGVRRMKTSGSILANCRCLPLLAVVAAVCLAAV